MARTRCQTLVRSIRRGQVEAYVKVPNDFQHRYFGLFKSERAARAAVREYCKSRGYDGLKRGCDCGKARR